jgi:hypothetical protein
LNHHFLVRLAEGELGSGVAAAVGVSVVWVQIVVSVSGGAQAVMVFEVHLWRQRGRLREFGALVCIGKRQKIVTSW